MSETALREFPFERPGALQPPPAYARLRVEAPLTRVATADGSQAWLLTRYDDVALVLTDPRFGVAPPGLGYPGNDSLFQDGAAHARLRRLVTRAFTARHLEALRPGCRASPAITSEQWRRPSRPRIWWPAWRSRYRSL